MIKMAFASKSNETVLVDIGIAHWADHSRWRVYPQDITVAPALTSAALANTFGAWAQIIPLNTIPFPFHVIGVCICQVSAVGNYHVQIGYNIVLADPGVNMEMGERRVRIAATPIARQTELLELGSQGIPANSRVMGRLKTDTGNADVCNVSVVLTRHISTTIEPALWPNFPW